MLTHGTPEWSGPGRGAADPAVVGHDEVGKRGRDAGQAGERAAGDAAALPLVAGAGRDECVDRGPVGVRAVVAVRGDRAVHEARVATRAACRGRCRAAAATPARSSRRARRRATRAVRDPVAVCGVVRDRGPRCACPRCHTWAPLCARVGSPPGGSILVTCAPWSASSMPVTGPRSPWSGRARSTVEHTVMCGTAVR